MFLNSGAVQVGHHSSFVVQLQPHQTCDSTVDQGSLQVEGRNETLLRFFPSKAWP